MTGVAGRSGRYPKSLEQRAKIAAGSRAMHERRRARERRVRELVQELAGLLLPDDRTTGR